MVRAKLLKKLVLFNAFALASPSYISCDVKADADACRIYTMSSVEHIILSSILLSLEQDVLIIQPRPKAAMHTYPDLPADPMTAICQTTYNGF